MRRWLVRIILVTAVLFTCLNISSYNSPINSGGLGLSRPQWERKYGSAKWEDSGQVLFREQEYRYLVWFWDGNAGWIDLEYLDRRTMALDVARNESQKLIPSDSKYIRTDESGSKYIADYYFSESLKRRFAQETWRGGEAGEFMISYEVSDGQVKRITLVIE